MDKETIIKSLKDSMYKLGNLIDLFDDAINLIEELDKKNKALETTLAETTDLARELLYHIGG